MLPKDPSGTTAAQEKELGSRRTFECPLGTTAAQVKNYTPDGRSKVTTAAKVKKKAHE